MVGWLPPSCCALPTLALPSQPHQATPNPPSVTPATQAEPTSSSSSSSSSSAALHPSHATEESVEPGQPSGTPGQRDNNPRRQGLRCKACGNQVPDKKACQNSTAGTSGSRHGDAVKVKQATTTCQPLASLMQCVCVCVCVRVCVCVYVCVRRRRDKHSNIDGHGPLRSPPITRCCERGSCKNAAEC